MPDRRPTRREYPLRAAAAALTLAAAGCERAAHERAPQAGPAVAAIDAVASRSARDADGRRIGSWWLRTVHSEGRHDTLTHTRRDGDYANAVVSYDNGGQLRFRVLLRRGDSVPPIQRTADFEAQAHRYIDTRESDRSAMRPASSRRPTIDRNSRSGWRVEELTNDYDNGGTLRIYIATDLQPPDTAAGPRQTAGESPGTIRLRGVAPLPADRDYMEIELYDGRSVEGSLDGVPGRFSCANPSDCNLVPDRAGGYRPSGEGISFTSADGAERTPIPVAAGPEAAADYLSFGHWLHAPGNAAEAGAHDFGVFASGGDPFEASNLAGLVGTATYAGGAAGMYFVGKDTANPVYGTFAAEVALTADFGDGVETGTVRGSVTGFDWPDDVAASLPAAVRLTSDNPSGFLAGYGRGDTADEDGLVRGASNVFDTPWQGRDSWRGGHVLGSTAAGVGGTEWWGHWQGAFFGNGDSAADRPASIAGTFTAADQTAGGLAGGFGARRQ